MPDSQTFIDAEFFLILDALDRGVLPTPRAAADLVDMGLLERAGEGFRMTALAVLRLAELRSARERSLPSTEWFPERVMERPAND